MSRAEFQTTHHRLTRVRRGLVTLLCSIIITVVVITGWIIHRNYLGRIASAERETRNLVRVLEEHAARLFSEADGVLSAAADQITTQGGLEHLDESALNVLFNRLLARHGLPQVQALFAAASSGRLRAMTGATDIASVQIGDRDYFQYWQTHAFAPLFVGQPVRNRVTGRWLISLSRRLDDPQGQFAGIIAAALDLDYFDRFYGELDLGVNGSVVLIRNDGIVLVRLPMVEGAIGRSVADSALLSPYLPLSFIRDITERKQVEQQVRLAATVFESSAEGILIADADNRIITVNQAFTRITGYASPEAVGRDPSLLKSGRHPPAFYRQFWQALHETGCWQGELWNRRKSGEIYPTWLAIGVVRDSQGAITRYIGILSDITQHKQAQERIYFLAHYDALTELPNRRLLADRAAQAIAAAQRNSVRLAVLFLDLDRFKQVNDSLGHLAGDLLLQAVAERLRKCVREADTLARLGGDEFVVMLPYAATPDAAARVARKCIETLAPPFNLGGHEIRISPSIGVSLYPDDGDHLELLLKNADAAMYRAKAAGRNNYQFFNPARVPLS